MTGDFADVHRLDVDGMAMAYRQVGTGPPVVMVHGNPTSSYLWRNIAPALADSHRVVAPDMIGMGQSDKLPDAGPDTYRRAVHQQFFDGFMAAMVDQPVVLVCHDWGGSLALDWARRHQSDVRGVAFMETIVKPRSWSEETEGGRELFSALRSGEGERMVLQENVFVETLLPAATRDLSAEDHDVYRRPFAAAGADRWPCLTWAREIPFDGEPADVTEVVGRYAEWLQQTPIPKLFVAAVPGEILNGEARQWCENLPNVETVEVAAGHFVPEDAPDAVAVALQEWLGSLD